MIPTAAGQALLDTFDLVLVINLASRRDRLREVDAQLRRLGLSFDHPRVRRFDARRFDDAAGFPTVGTRGCFHSHMDAWTGGAAAGAASVLLLEDDVDFAADVETRLPETLRALAAGDWSVFYGAVLDWQSRSPVLPSPARAEPDEGVLGGHFVAMRGEALATIGDYLAAIAGRPHGSPEGGPMHVDGAYNWFRRAHPHLVTRIAVPDLAHQRSSRTDIHALALKDRVPLLRGITAMVRRLRRRRR